MNTVMMDLQFASRVLRANPGFTAVCVLTLALGIGANTTLFSIVNAVLLRPLPYRDAAQLVWLGREMPELKAELLGSIDYFHWKDQSRTLQSITAFDDRGEAVTLAGTDGPERLRGTRTSRDFFAMFGVRPVLGRAFTEEEDQPGGPRTVILTYGLWQRRFGSDPNILGRTLVLNDEPCTVVGVMPPGFRFPRQPDLDVIEPMQLSRSEAESGGMHRVRLVSAIGRLRPGATPVDALKELRAISERSEPGGDVFTGPVPDGAPRGLPPQRGELRIEIGPGGPPGPSPVGTPGQIPGPSRVYTRKGGPGSNDPLPGGGPGLMQSAQIRVIPLQEKLVGNVRPALLILLGAVGFVLLIACANVANLLLARAAARQKEITIRAALGASRTRIVLQLLTESLALSFLGGILGLAVAFWGIRLFTAFMPGGAAGNVFLQADIGIDGRVLGFMALVSILTGFAFGIAPALAAVRMDIHESLKEHGSTTHPYRRLLRGSLVAAELTLALMLLSGAGLLLNSFARVLSVDLGYNPAKVLTMAVDLSDKRYPEPSQRKAFFRELLQRVRTLPGVDSAGLANSLPLSEPTMVFKGLQIEGRPESEEDPAVYASGITPGYFPAIGMRLMQGRFFDDHDDENSARVAIINEAMASFFWPGQSAIGKRFRIGPVFGGASVVGIVANVRRQTLESEGKPEIYLPYLQVPDVHFMQLAVRTRSGTSALVSPVRTTVAALDRSLALYEVSTLEEKVAAAVAPRRFNLLLLGVFAALALVLAAVGMYGVMDYAVTRRRQEIGVRMALGARRSDVLRMVVGRGMALAAIGMAGGLAGSFLITRVLRNQLYGVTATDPLTYAAAAAVLALTALLASCIPAGKATKVDPAEALRYE